MNTPEHFKKYIVTTTIYSVSEAIKKFVTFKNWNIIIVGDKKTPHNEYKLLQEENSNVQYLSPEEQEIKYNEIPKTNVKLFCVIKYFEQFLKNFFPKRYPNPISLKSPYD